MVKKNYGLIFKEFVESYGYILLSEYVNSSTKVKIRCPKCHHEYKVLSNNFKKGIRCPVCADNCPIQAEKIFKELLTKERYELLSEYKNNKTKVKIRCPKCHHEYKVKPNSFKQGSRCPHCEGSTGQRKLQSMLEIRDLGSMVYNNRTILNGLELDIYYPELNIAIEYQGNYWHNRPETKERDKRKKKLCKEKGIKLIEVWDDDFLKNPDLIEHNLVNEIIGYM